MNFVTTKERILQFIDYKGVSIKDFLSKTDIKRGFLDSDKLNAAVSDLFITKIIAIYPDLNIDWLLTGKGEMLKPEYQEKPKAETSYPEIKGGGNKVSEPMAVYGGGEGHIGSIRPSVPLYDIEASAGFISSILEQRQFPVGYVHIPKLEKCDGAVYVRGDSMHPVIKTGDIVAFKIIHDIKNAIIWGKMYLVDIDIEGEGFLSVKYIQKSKKSEDYILLISENDFFQPKEVHLKHVRGLAVIKAFARVQNM